MIWTLHDIAAATQGQLSGHAGDAAVHGIALDNRKVSSGDLFVAIKGDNHDGHDYVAAAHHA
ncbi:MAG: UDP-N-acetylmuramoyl-tripeptide--D-alanyl-D-alanine ligase, partial [Alphaproteobacteria bacterium]|nr:UDP-N-acetylmuramoyl-tripeptide--D-alanyl-D-alanine ligase [Alphaproteobacteria bacterium]